MTHLLLSGRRCVSDTSLDVSLTVLHFLVPGRLVLHVFLVCYLSSEPISVHLEETKWITCLNLGPKCVPTCHTLKLVLYRINCYFRNLLTSNLKFTEFKFKCSFIILPEGLVEYLARII